MISSDTHHMHHALSLARRALGTRPNPAVGCVLVGDGQVVGVGYTAPGGRPHAETQALENAGERAKGATAYVTLEPCSHTGRTPPCADALIAAGVAEVVVAITDPDPNVAGSGIGRLRAAGITVTAADGEQEAVRQLEAYLKHRRTGRPFVIAKFAATLDGKIAAASGDSRWVAGDEARVWAHGFRTTIDAIMCGVNNVLLDDPQLTARPGGVMADRQPLRIVADSRGRTPLDASVLGPGGKTLIATTSQSRQPWRDAIAQRGAAYCRCSSRAAACCTRASSRPVSSTRCMPSSRRRSSGGPPTRLSPGPGSSGWRMPSSCARLTSSPSGTMSPSSAIRALLPIRK